MKQDLSFEMLAGGLEYLLVLDQLSAVDQNLSLVTLAGGLECLSVPETGIGYEAGFVI